MHLSTVKEDARPVSDPNTAKICTALTDSQVHHPTATNQGRKFVANKPIHLSTLLALLWPKVDRHPPVSNFVVSLSNFRIIAALLPQELHNEYKEGRNSSEKTASATEPSLREKQTTPTPRLARRLWSSLLPRFRSLEKSVSTLAF